MSGQQSKAEKIEQVKSNLPLPEQPPAPSDWNTADNRSLNVGSGGISNDEKHSTVGLREPATQPSEEVDFRGVGRDAEKNVPA
jgi:hypothetical protein